MVYSVSDKGRCRPHGKLSACRITSMIFISYLLLMTEPVCAVSGDFVEPQGVDLYDFAYFSSHWLQKGLAPYSGADLTGDGNVNIQDLLEFSENWMAGMVPHIQYSVEACDMDFALWDDEIGAAQQAESEELRFTVTVKGRLVYFEDLIAANCCIDEIELRMTVIDGSYILLEEIDHWTDLCWCICDFPTEAILGPFEPGEYLLEVLDINGTSLGIVPITIEG